MGSWYETPEGVLLLNSTNRGQLIYLWEARYKDGTISRMYEDFIFERALVDPKFVPNPELRATVDHLDRDHVSEIRLYPIKLVEKLNPLHQLRVCPVNLRFGERFVCYWLTDFSVKFKTHLRRTVVGIERISPNPENKFDLLVISPSGKTKFCHDDNQSYENE